MDRVEFNETTHAYEIAGVEYPSVTEICSPISSARLNTLPKHIVTNAARRGAEVHGLISEFVMSEDVDSVVECATPETFPYFCGFMEWWRTYKPITLFSEFVMGDAKLGYCGTCDFIGIIDGNPVLIDFKTTSTIDKKYLAVQLAGYKLLCAVCGIAIGKTYVLHLKKDGGYTFKEIEPDYEWFDILHEHNKRMRSKNGR